jgi:hypothetical protein
MFSNFGLANSLEIGIDSKKGLQKAAIKVDDLL